MKKITGILITSLPFVTVHPFRLLKYTLPAALVNSSWKDAFNDTKTTLKTTVTLEPYSYIVYKIKARYLIF